MITIEHGITRKGLHYATVPELQRSCDTVAIHYAIGLHEPNYPMPAIRYDIDIRSDHVFIQQKPWFNYEPILIYRN